MAIMATEQPQSLPADQKVTKSSGDGDEMMIDEPVPKAVNGHSQSDATPVESEETSGVNGKANLPEQPTEANRQAFAANGSLPEQIPVKPEADEPSTEDKEMTVVNGSGDEVQENAKDEADVPAPQPAVDGGEEAKDVDRSNDAIDMDMSAEHPDPQSSAEHAPCTQKTSAISDSMVVSSPQASSLRAEPSRSDTKATEDSQKDVVMSDAGRSATPTKTRREREDEDTSDQPAAKRAKTEEAVGDSIGVATGVSPDSIDTIEALVNDVPNDQTIASHQNKELRKLIGNIKKKKSGANFKASVEKLWPALWPNYQAMIETPVDLSLFEHRLRDDEYANFGEFKADVRRLHENATKYNGPDNPVTVAALEVKQEIFRRMKELATLKAPAKPDKGKSQPTRHTEPRAATQPRRQSHSQPQPSASSPKPKADTVVAAISAAPPTPASSTASAPAFALPPNGVPQIRRDSTRDDGDRPKRPIVPPKNRDPDYSSKASRKKKLGPEMRFYLDIITDLMKPKYHRENVFFKDPVDPVAQQIPTYFHVVKRPMDLKTMLEKLENGEYSSGKEVDKDMRQIVGNSELFNGQVHDVTKLARELEAIYKEKVARKEDWMQRYAPAPAAAAGSPDPSDHDSEDESEPEPEEEDNESIRTWYTKLSEEQDKLNTLLSARKPEMQLVEIQQTIVNMVQKQLVEAKVKLANEPKKSKSKKKSSKKSKAGGSGAVGGHKKTASAVTSHKKSSSTTKKQPKKRHMGGLEKAVIADGINELDGPLLTKAVEIIKKDTSQKEDDDGQLELDIEVLSQDAMIKLFDMIMKAFPHIYAQVAARPEFSKEVAEQQQQQDKAKTHALPKAKKNKPMNKEQQERNIEKLREIRAKLNRGGSGSQEPLPGLGDQRAGDSSGEDEESDDSEED